MNKKYKILWHSHFPDLENMINHFSDDGWEIQTDLYQAINGDFYIVMKKDNDINEGK